MCLTGTVTAKSYKAIKEGLKLKSPITLSMKINRPNIFVSVVKIKASDFSKLGWLINMLKIDEDCPKTIIYCRSAPHVAFIYDFLNTNLGDHQFAGGDISLKSRKIAMFHRVTAPENKDLVIEEFAKADSPIRLVVASSAFGMGIDVPDIRYVVFFGCPRTMESFLQQMGRAGRDGRESYTVILDYPVRDKCDKDMAEFLTTTNCRRTILNQKFKIPLTKDDHIFENDATCSNACCDKCDTSDALPWSLVDINSTSESVLELCLQDFVEQLKEEDVIIDYELLVNSVVEDIDKYSSVEFILNDFDLPYEMAELLLEVIREIPASV